MSKIQDMSAVTRELGSAIERRYAEPEWFTLPHVGMDGRLIDYIAFGLWRSRGNLILGFEIKASRSDWLRELKNPSKAELTTLACDEWWIVAPRGTVMLDELPRGWGLLEKRGRGLRCVAKAQTRQADFCRQMVASFIRRSRLPDSRAVNEAYGNGYRAGAKDMTEREGREERVAKHGDEIISKWLIAFRAASGYDLLAEDATDIGRLFAATHPRRDIRMAVEDYLREARDCATRILDLVNKAPEG